MRSFESWTGRRLCVEESNKILLSRLEDLFLSDRSPGSAVALEVGCGAGSFSSVLRQVLFSRCPDSETRLYSLDIDMAAIAATHRRFRGAVERGAYALRGDLYRLPFRRQQFDYFLAFNVLYWANRGLLLREAHRVLKPTGKLLSYDLLPVANGDLRPVFFFTLDSAQIAQSYPESG